MNFTLLIPIALGWASGLFINYASDVLPRTRRFSQPQCHNCETRYSWLDYLTLRACRNCGIVRPLRIWIVQILTVASFAYFWLNPPKALGLPLSLIVLVYFAVITVIDLEHRLILFPTSVFGAGLGLLVGTLIYHNALKQSLVSSIGASLLGGVIGFGALFLLYQLGTLLARYRAKRMGYDDNEEALGGGDVYLAGVLGLMLGSRYIISGLGYGIILGGLASILFLLALAIRGKNQALMTFIPYGPYLIAGAFYVLFLG